MRKCKAKIQAIIACTIAFGAGILLSFFLPQGFLIIIEAVIICGIGILCLL